MRKVREGNLCFVQIIKANNQSFIEISLCMIQFENLRLLKRIKLCF